MIKHTTWFYYSMKEKFLILRDHAGSPVRVITALIALCFSYIPAMANYTCPNQANVLADSAVVSGTTASCFRFEVPPGSPFVRFQLDANVNSMDLFFSPGTNNTLKDWDRVNAGPVQGEMKFVLLQPDPGPYTMAVVPQPGAASYDLSATTGIGGGDSEPLVFCEGDICTTALPMKIAAQAIQLGSKFGDRLIFPVNVSGPGKIDVEVGWTGSAKRLAIILNGPDRPELSNPVAYYARRDGSSPLKLSYSITSKDLKNGKRFKINVVNFSGGEALGDIKITKPKSFLLNIQNLTLMQPKINQEKLCAQKVQGKIAWNYEGNKKWDAQNVKRLCRGTTKAAEPGRCFDTVMHRGVNWGSGSQWEWENALDLCEGTNNATLTVRCFRGRIQKGAKWKQAINACDALK